MTPETKIKISEDDYIVVANLTRLRAVADLLQKVIPAEGIATHREIDEVRQRIWGLIDRHEKAID